MMWYAWPLPRNENRRRLYATEAAAMAGAQHMAREQDTDVEVDDPCGKLIATVMQPAEIGATPDVIWEE